MVEQVTFNHLVADSSSAQSTTFMPEETHEEQILRCLKTMVENVEVLMEHREDGELYFSLVDPTTLANDTYVYEL